MPLRHEDGTELEKHIYNGKWGMENLLTDVELKRKFMEQFTLAIGPDRAARSYETFTQAWQLRDMGKIRGTDQDVEDVVSLHIEQGIYEVQI